MTDPQSAVGNIYSYGNGVCIEIPGQVQVNGICSVFDRGQEWDLSGGGVPDGTALCQAVLKAISS